MRPGKLVTCGQSPRCATGPTCHRCGRPATFASIWPSEVRPRAVFFSCANRRHGRAGGYQIFLPQLDAHLEHLLSIERKARAGHMLAAAVRRFEPTPDTREMT